MSVTATHAPVRVGPSFREKIWGSTRLSPWFPDSKEKIGEVWFDLADEAFPILTKFIFTTERLSVQVHPDDEYAREHENSRGKTEMWYVLRADPGAQVAVGLRQTISAEHLKEVAKTGEIEHLLNWADVHPGDCIFTPAGTIHAIGAGLALAEIQQHSDVTYRLYDYGRPRDLHLDRGIDVSVAGPYRPPSPHEGFLAWCPYFATQELALDSPVPYQLETRQRHLLIVIEGSGTINAHPFRCGEVWQVPEGTELFPIEPHERVRFLRTYVP